MIKTFLMYISDVCDENLLVFVACTAIAVFAFASFLMEIVLIVCFRCCCKASERSNSTSNLLHELYNTRGRKMALVHVRAERNDKGATGWTVHISSAFVSIVLIGISIFTLANYGITVFYCFISNTCDCTFLNPAVLLTIVFGAIVVLLQLIFLMGFCIRKIEERKYRNYAKKREDVAGYIATESPSKHSVVISSSTSRPSSAKTQTEQNGKSNGKSEEALPGSVAV
ncbi:hypothetical protein CHUAL_007159 [Chamberlinius hualienensis]